MSSFSSATIRKKVFFTALILFFTIFAFKIFELSLLDILNNELKNNIDKNFNVLKLGNNLETSVNSYLSSVANYSISPNKKFIILFEDSQEKFNKTLKDIKAFNINSNNFKAIFCK